MAISRNSLLNNQSCLQNSKTIYTVDTAQKLQTHPF